MVKPQNIDSQYGTAPSGAVLILLGLLVAFATPFAIDFEAGDYPVALFWNAGWFLVAVGGWMLPNRLIAGIFIGAAIASIGYFLLIWVSTRDGMG